MKTWLLICFGLAAFIHSAIAAASDLDLTFGGGTGKVTTAIGSTDDHGWHLAIQSDGKILVAGYSNSGSNQDIAVVRYNTDGSLDTTFGGTGKVTTGIGLHDDQGTGLAIQSDGKIIVSGIAGNGSNNDFAVVRYNTDGSLDTTFGGTGKVTTDMKDEFSFGVAIQSDGKIVLVGASNLGGNYAFAVVRYNLNGSLDTNFNGTGKVTTAIGIGRDIGSSVAIQGDGKIVVAGSSFNGSNDDFAVVRYNADGSLDTSFNGTGKVSTAVGSGDDQGIKVVIQADDKIVVSGSSGSGSDRDFALVRYNTDGSLDTNFNCTGKVTTDVGGADDWGLRIALQRDEKIVMTGFSFNGSNRSLALVRYNVDGTLDTSFNGSGKLTTTFGSSDDAGNDVGVQGDGKIVVTATTLIRNISVFAVLRYEGDPPGRCTPHKARANAQLVNGFVVRAIVTDAGCGYTNPPVVLIQDGGGSGALARAYISDGKVTEIGITDAGCCYTSTPRLVIGSPPFVPTVNIAVKKVNVTQNVVLGWKYVLESSTNAVSWAPTGPPFVADSESVVTEFDVDTVGRLFRLRVVP